MYYEQYIPPPSTVHLVTILLNLSQMLLKAERATTAASSSPTHRPKHFCGTLLASQHCSGINKCFFRIRKSFPAFHIKKNSNNISITVLHRHTRAYPIDTCFCLRCDTFTRGSPKQFFLFFESVVFSHSVSTTDRTLS